MVDLVDSAKVLECIDSNTNYLYTICKKLGLHLATTSKIFTAFWEAGFIRKIKERKWRNRKRYRLTELGEEALKLKEYLEKRKGGVSREDLPFSPLCINGAKKAGLIEEEEKTRRLTIFQSFIRKKTKRCFLSLSLYNLTFKVFHLPHNHYQNLHST